MLTALYFVVFVNIRFFTNVIDVYPLDMTNLGYLASLAVVLVCVLIAGLSLLLNRFTLKPVLITLLMIAALSAYFMDSYEIVIDTAMLQNAFETNTAEVYELLSAKLMLYILLLGIAPALFIYRAEIRYAKLHKEAAARCGLFFASLALCAALVFALSDFYASFLRKHKPLRYYTNPAYPLYSAGKAVFASIKSKAPNVMAMGQHANIPASDVHRELVIMVVGETARADRFSLNGYARKTNPLLEQEKLVSYTNFWACGTSTTDSLPCMFSQLGRAQYTKDTAAASENVLDVLSHAGVNVLWRDNNSTSKGVMDRLPFFSYRTEQENSICDPECRDEGMLVGLQEHIDSIVKGDVFIVLHQLGSHGPAYYQRYPARFEHFTPVCRTNQLQMCRTQEIDNAYDNTILYTDYFLSRVIALLKQNDKRFETAMLYVSDHGESLGELGVYLHGMPYLIAPEAQIHVPAIVWLGANFDHTSIASLNARRDQRYSHDNLFHTILGLVEIDDRLYDTTLDLLRADSGQSVAKQ